jgi:mono/diheme cytochrome c family protein
MYRRLLPASVRKSACPLSILRLAIMGLATAGWLANAAADEALQASEQFFESSIRPVLHSQCVKCHGENKQEGNLRLDSLEGLLKGGDSGPAIVVGKPQESLLMEAVRYESFEMPPVKPLKDEQISDLEKWIA